MTVRLGRKRGGFVCYPAPCRRSRGADCSLWAFGSIGTDRTSFALNALLPILACWSLRPG